MTKIPLVTVLLAVGVLVTGVAAQPPSQVVLNNPTVRVEVWTLPPGLGMGRHQGIEVEVVIAVDGDLTLDSPAGRTVLPAGGAYSFPGLTPHDVRNEGNRPVKMFAIFLKRCD